MAENTLPTRVMPGDISVYFEGESAIVQREELNELQEIGDIRVANLAGLIISTGERVKGAEIILDRQNTSITLTAGRIAIGGNIFDIEAATIENVPMVGRVTIGVQYVEEKQTYETRPNLLGRSANPIGNLEPGAARINGRISWALENDSGEGQFVSVYLLQDGTPVDQTPPPALSGVNKAIAQYDRTRGNYIVSGCRVTGLGIDTGAQNFTIEAGEAHVNGYKFTRYTALRHREVEAPQTATVVGESHNYVGAGAYTFAVNFGPIASVETVLVEKQKTIMVTRGEQQHGSDTLPHTSITTIVSVTQGPTTYVQGVDFLETSDNIDWSPVGAEPAGGSQFEVTYRYRDAIAPIHDATQITVDGGYDGGEVIISYTRKLPRVDLLCLDEQGYSVYVQGVSDSPLAPEAPANYLKLAEVHNSWNGKPTVVNNGVYSRTYEELDVQYRTQQDLLRLTMIERGRTLLDAREPVAKRNMVVDPFLNDDLRDFGFAQSGAVGNGILQMPMEVTVFAGAISTPIMLDYVEEVIIEQPLATACEKINPYQNFNKLPAAMRLEPAVDHWSDTQEVWTSPATLSFNQGVRWDNGPLTASSVAERVVDTRTEQAEFLRQIDVVANIEGFFSGEELESFTFDGIEITPNETQTANADGLLSIAFTIPANITAGMKLVVALGKTGSRASAQFVGEGIITVTTMQRVTSIQRWSRGVVQNTGDDDDDSETNADPQAQTFTPGETRQITGVDIKLCNIGNPQNNILVQQVSVENGIPTTDIIAEAFLNVSTLELGWVHADYRFPTLSSNQTEHAFVVKTDDADHSIAVANLGEADNEAGVAVSQHPYTTGVRLSSVNASTWTPHQNSSAAFRVRAAKFTDTIKTVELGSFDLVNASDLQVRATVDLPSGDCSVVFEIERNNGTIYRLLPSQVLQLSEYLTETVVLRAVLTGTEKLSPILYAPVALLAGEIGREGTYITRAFDLGTSVRLTSYFKAFLPTGASAKLEYQIDDVWTDFPAPTISPLNQQDWTEPRYEASDLTGVHGRLRLTISNDNDGTQVNRVVRPRIGDFGSYIAGGN